MLGIIICVLAHLLTTLTVASGNQLPISDNRQNERLGFPCVYNRTKTAYGSQAYWDNRFLDKYTEIPHGTLLRFHCPIPRFYRLVGPSTVRCLDGGFDEEFPVCEPFLLSNRLTVLVDTEYVLGPGGEYVVFPGAEVKMSCYHMLSRKFRPQWQWEGHDDVFVEETSIFGQVTSELKFVAKPHSRGVFVCSDSTEDIAIRVVVRGLHCPNIGQSADLRVHQINWLRAEFACRAPSILYGAASASCMHFRDWDATPPSCIRDGCVTSWQEEKEETAFPCVLPIVSGGLIGYRGMKKVESGDVFQPGESVLFHCEPLGRVRLVGESNLTCLTGNWSASLPVCAISVPPGVFVSLDFPHTVGPSGVVYVFDGTPVKLRCTSPSRDLVPVWQYDPQASLNLTDIVSEAQHISSATRMLIFEAIADVINGSSLIFVCKTNSKSATQEERKITIQIKKEVCDDFAASSGLVWKMSNDTAVFACDPPSILYGSSILHCVNGQWDSPQPRCVYQRCPTESKHTRATILPTTFSIATTESVTTVPDIINATTNLPVPGSSESTNEIQKRNGEVDFEDPPEPENAVHKDVANDNTHFLRPVGVPEIVRKDQQHPSHFDDDESIIDDELKFSFTPGKHSNDPERQPPSSTAKPSIVIPDERLEPVTSFDEVTRRHPSTPVTVPIAPRPIPTSSRPHFRVRVKKIRTTTTTTVNPSDDVGPTEQPHHSVEIVNHAVGNRDPNAHRSPSSSHGTNQKRPRCPETNGLFYHPNDCHKFLHCSFNVASVVTCPDSLMFHPELKICVRDPSVCAQ